MHRAGVKCDHDRAAKRADALDAGEQADAFRPEMQIVLTDHRDHAGEGPAENIEDHGDGQRCAQATIAQSQFQPFADARHHEAGGMLHRLIAVANPQCGNHCDEIKPDADAQGSENSDGRQQEAADRRPGHAARVV